MKTTTTIYGTSLVVIQTVCDEIKAVLATPMNNPNKHEAYTVDDYGLHEFIDFLSVDQPDLEWANLGIVWEMKQRHVGVVEAYNAGYMRVGTTVEVK